MSRSRHSLANVLRQVRGARGAASRTAVRYAKRDDVRHLVDRAAAMLNKAEALLLDARTRATAAVHRRERRAA